MKALAPMEVGFAVADIDAVLPFYRDVLGLKVLSDVTAPADKSRQTGLAPEGYRVMRLENEAGDRLKLAQPTLAPLAAAPRAFALERQGGAYATFIVGDIDDLLERFRTAGADVRSAGKVEVRPGVWVLLVRDPEGNHLEFVQYADLSSYRPGPKS
ncbi:MAG TPA: VOC family protein [Rhodocyclaceae bacterium]|nr:VOC family protein [Rhodocyclaceae bacterium]